MAWSRGLLDWHQWGHANGMAGGGWVQCGSRLALVWGHVNGVARDGEGAGEVNLCEYCTSATLLGVLDLDRYVGQKATSVMSEDAEFMLNLLLSPVAICRGNLHDVAYPVSIHTNSVWGKCKQKHSPCSRPY